MDGAKAGDVLQDWGVVDQRVRRAGVVDEDAVPCALAGGGYSDSVPRDWLDGVRVPEEFILSADGPGDLLVGGCVVGGVVDEQHEVAIDGGDAGPVSGPFDFRGIVGFALQTVSQLVRELLVDITAVPGPFNYTFAVVDLEHWGSAVYSGDDVLPWAKRGIVRPQP